MACTLLLVEDHDLSRRTMARALRKAQHNVQEATSGEAAVELLARINFSAVISDLRLPGRINGLDVLKEQREKSPAAKLLLVTAFGSAEAQKRAEQLGAVYIEKPVHLDLMLSIVGA